MRPVLAQDEKPLYWVAFSKRDFLGFPAAVKEIVESHDGNAYRAVYTVRFEKALYVLHAFQKKSPPAVERRRGMSSSWPSA